MAKTSIRLTDLKKYLKNASKDELMDEIVELFKRFDSVKDYYHDKLAPQADPQLEMKYKKIIKNQFFPSRGYGQAKLSIAKKAITDYKKVTNNPAHITDMMLFYVEQGTQFTKSYGDINEAFYNSMEGMYAKVIEWIVKFELEDLFDERCRTVIKEASQTGWGFAETLAEIYNEAFFPEEEDDDDDDD